MTGIYSLLEGVIRRVKKASYPSRQPEHRKRIAAEYYKKLTPEQKKARLEITRRIRANKTHKYPSEQPEYIQAQYVRRQLAAGKKLRRKHPPGTNYKRLHYLENREKIKARVKLWSKNHPERRRFFARKYASKLQSTPKGRLDHRISTAINNALKGGKNGRSWELLVGFTVDELMNHIESRFSRGMTWKKLMSGEIHIDHKIPKSKFKYTSSEDLEFRRCWALENLQPMWATANLSKRNRIIEHSQIPLGV